MTNNITGENAAYLTGLEITMDLVEAIKAHGPEYVLGQLCMLLGKEQE